MPKIEVMTFVIISATFLYCKIEVDSSSSTFSFLSTANPSSLTVCVLNKSMPKNFKANSGSDSLISFKSCIANSALIIIQPYSIRQKRHHYEHRIVVQHSNSLRLKLRNYLTGLYYLLPLVSVAVYLPSLINRSLSLCH